MKSVSKLLTAGLILLKISLEIGAYQSHEPHTCDRPCDVGYYPNTIRICFKEECNAGNYCYRANERFENMNTWKRKGLNKTCEKSCKDFPDCKFFSYSTQNDKCLRSDSKGIIVFEEGRVFGEKNCSQPYEDYRRTKSYCNKFTKWEDQIRCRLAFRELIYSATKFDFSSLQKALQDSAEENGVIGSFSILSTLSFLYSLTTNEKALRENVFTGIHPNEVKSGIKHLNEKFSHHDSQFVPKSGLLSYAPFDDGFKKAAEEVFHVQVENNIEQDEVNSWAHNVTNGLISTIIPKGTSMDTYGAVYISAQHLKPEWAIQFNKNSYEDSFGSSLTEIDNVIYMKTSGKFRVADGPKAKTLEVPLKGNKLRMLFILPDEGSENNFDLHQSFVSSLKFPTGKSDYEIHIPKFSVETTLEGFPGLKNMPKQLSANFDKFSNKLVFEKILHKTILNIDEGGEETLIDKVFNALRWSPKVFKLDRPFFFVIQDTETQIVLAVGKITNPKLDPRKKEELRKIRALQKLSSIASNSYFPLLQKSFEESANGNVVIGSSSILTTLSLLYSTAADGDTLKSLKETIFNGMEPEDAKEAMRDLIHHWSLNGSQVMLASKIFELSDTQIKDEFKDEIKAAFNMETESLKDVENPEKTINTWVSHQTNGKIKDIIPEGAIGSSSGVVLASALHLKAKWDEPFDPRSSYEGYFFSSSMDIPNVKYMKRKGEYRVADGPLNATTLEVLLEGQKLRMLFILPNEKEESAYDRFQENPFKKIPELAFHEKAEYEIHIPAFTVETSVNVDQMAHPFPSLHDLFDPDRANFSKMGENLVISKIIHKTYLNIDEEGVEGSSASGILFEQTSRVKSFHVNRPFFFVLQDLNKKIDIFAGKIKEPRIILNSIENSSSNQEEYGEYE